MQQLQPFTTVTNGNKPLSSFQLITNWLDIGYTLNLSPSAMQVMTTLLRFYNPEKKFVFPHQATIAQKTRLSLATIKRSLNDLINAKLILKSRTKKGNVYGFTSKLFELLDSLSCTIQTAQCEPCNRTDKRTDKITTANEKLNQPESKKVVVFSQNFLKSRNITLNDVPKSIKSNKKVKNPCAYWASLTQEQKAYYLQKEQAETAKQAQIAELKKQAEIEKAKERAVQEIENKRWNALPINEKYPLNKAIKYIWSFRNFAQKTPLTLQLIDFYNLDVAKIAQMTQAEIDSLQNV